MTASKSNKSTFRIGALPLVVGALLLVGSAMPAYAGELPHNPGYWKTHVDEWPVESLAIGDELLTVEELVEWLKTPPRHGDQSTKLVHQLIAAKLNIAAGVDGSLIAQVVLDADEFLIAFPPGSDPSGEDYDFAKDLWHILKDFNNGKLMTLPITLASFDAIFDGNTALLRWTTANEENNSGFEIETRPEGTELGFRTIGFVPGVGNSTKLVDYTFRVSDLGPGNHEFRLRQVDFDGTYAYSPSVEISVELASAIQLEGAWPNPFNPSTNIRFHLKEQANVALNVYDMTGRHVRTLLSASMASGAHEVRFEAGDLSSGLYLYRLSTSAGTATGTVSLIK